MASTPSTVRSLEPNVTFLSKPTVAARSRGSAFGSGVTVAVLGENGLLLRPTQTHFPSANDRVATDELRALSATKRSKSSRGKSQRQNRARHVAVETPEKNSACKDLSQACTMNRDDTRTTHTCVTR